MKFSDDMWTRTFGNILGTMSIFKTLGTNEQSGCRCPVAGRNSFLFTMNCIIWRVTILLCPKSQWTVIVSVYSG